MTGYFFRKKKKKDWTALDARAIKKYASIRGSRETNLIRIHKSTLSIRLQSPILHIAPEGRQNVLPVDPYPINYTTI